MEITKLLIYRNKFIAPYIKRSLAVATIITHIMSLLFILAMVYRFGFLVTENHAAIIGMLSNWAKAIFMVNTALHLIFNYKESRAKFKTATWIGNLLLYITLIPLIFPVSANSAPLLVSIWHFIGGNLFLWILLFSLSLFQLSSGVMQLLSKRVNPSFIFSVSFLLFILIGTGLLMLPNSTIGSISFIDALFTSTSAICVTGLTTVDMSTTFTHMGQLFIMGLIQVGGLGVMTLTSFFAMFFMGNSSLYNQVVMCDMVSSKSINSLFRTLIYILSFTLIIEAIGAIMIWLNIHKTLNMSLNEEIFFSIFHSISAFCNAGFSTLPNNLGNEMLITNHNPFYIVISLLIIFGGLGFPILVNLYESLKYNIGKIREAILSKTLRMRREAHIYDTNTHIVLTTTTVLIVVGTIMIAATEWNNSFEGMSFFDKIVQSFFTAICPRTAGFNSVATSSLSMQSILLLMILMVIGGGTQSTAGGVKINVFAVILLNLRAILLGTNEVTAYKRRLDDNAVRSCNSALILYLIFAFVAIFILTILEPTTSLKVLAFETISALSTVGSSLDFTPTMGTDSKIVIIILMFVGRVGVLTLMSSLIKPRQKDKCKFPSGKVIIN